MTHSDCKFRYPFTKRTRSELREMGFPQFVESGEYQSKCELPQNDQRQVNQNLPRILEAIFRPKGLTSGARSVEISPSSGFVEVVVDAAINGSVESWLLNLGLGGSERIPSWRLIEQISPILESALQLQKAGFGSPRIQIFKANNLALFANKLDPEKVAASSVATMIFIEGYVADWYSTLLPSLELEEDCSAWLSKTIDGVLRPLAKKLPLDRNMERLSRNRSSSENAMIYGLAHAFQLQHVSGMKRADQKIWSSGNVQICPDAVVTFGGVPERLFADVIELAVKASPSDDYQAVPRARSIARSCRKPSYLPLPEEISIQQIPTLAEMRSQSMVKTIADDWRQLMERHEFDLAMASGSGATPLARLVHLVHRATNPSS